MKKIVKELDAVILGAGIAGLGCALALARAGRKVLLLGKKNRRGESSPAAAGILDPLLEMKPGGPLLKLSLAAFRRYPLFIRELKRQTGADADYVKTGILYAAKNGAEAKILKRRYLWQKRLGFSIRRMMRQEMLKFQPALSDRVLFGIHYPAIGKVNPAKLVALMSRWVKKLDGRILKFPKEPRVVLKKNRVRGVAVGGRFFESAVVINAAGSWAGSRHFKIRPPVRPVRGQILLLKGQARISTILHSLDGAYIVPWGTGKYLVGSTVEFVGFKPEVTAEGIRDIRQRAEALAPGIRPLKRMDAWAGLRPLPKDRMPILGATRVKGLYVATGYYRSGILIGPYAGYLLAKGILSGKMPPELEPFSPQRFGRKP